MIGESNIQYTSKDEFFKEQCKESKRAVVSKYENGTYLIKFQDVAIPQSFSDKNYSNFTASYQVAAYLWNFDL